MSQYETSMNFDMENVSGFLERLNSNFDLGITVADLTKNVAGIPLDAEKSWSIEVEHRGEKVELRIGAFMDDIDAPDLYFFSESEALIELIDEELDRFADEKGM